jgi:DNA-3-methyladenine glycosylase I
MEMAPKAKERTRCPWTGDDPLYVAYHDEEWGVPERDDRALFEKLLLDGFQAGLSWITILRRRDAYRRAYRGFHPRQIAGYTARDVARLMADPGIIRNRAKIEGSIKNARAYLALVEQEGGFAPFLWAFVGGETKFNRPETLRQVPTESAESRAMSKALKARGFSFVGPTICYAFMQATGMVDDHLASCFKGATRPLQAIPAAAKEQ